MKVDRFLDPETWLKEHGDYLFRYALARLRNNTIAEDLVQETFLAAVKGKDQFRGLSSERTWLVGILKHKMMDYFRKSTQEFPVTNLTSSEELPEDFFDRNGRWKVNPASWEENPREVLEKKEFWEKFEECMAVLPGRLAQIFTLREFEGLKGEEMCNLLKISATNLGVMLHRARLRLAKCLENKWFSKE